MKNRILYILLAVVLALSVGLVGCPPVEPEPPAPEAIIVGLARDLDGPLSVFECGYGGSTYRLFARTVNEEGGIYLSDYDAYVEIELWVRDFDVATWNIAEVTEGLIEDGAHFIWGGPGTPCIPAQSAVCNAEAIVLITLEGGTSTMIWEEQIDVWPYTWVTLSFSNWYQIPTLHDMLEAKTLPRGDRDPIAYVTYIGGPGLLHGVEYLTETKNEFGAENVIDKGAHPYILTAEDADTIVATAITDLGDPADPNYDIFCAWTYPWNCFTLAGAFRRSEFNPPAIILGPGGNTQPFGYIQGVYANGIMGFVTGTPESSPALAAFFDDLAEQIEMDWDDPALPCEPGILPDGHAAYETWGPPCYYSGLQMWKKAIENAGNIDSTAVRAELAAFNETNPCPGTLFGPCWFVVFGDGYGGGILDYRCHYGEIGQWQDGVYEIVGGRAPTATFLYPYTGQWAWLLD